jgi:hypothetical protein
VSRGTAILLLAALAGLPWAGIAGAQEDPGKSVVGKVNVTVYFATDGDVAASGPKALALDPAVEKRLRTEQKLRFNHYRMLGGDTQALFRSYENWVQPLKPSDEVLVRFEARSRPTPQATRLDLELWLSRKKILKTDVLLEGDRPLFVLGPVWRGGRLIIAVSLAADPSPR